MNEFINFYLAPGIVLGSIYALGAIGITMTFGILRFANFAHGETMTLGVYIAWTLVQLTGLNSLLQILDVRQFHLDRNDLGSPAYERIQDLRIELLAPSSHRQVG